MHQAERVLLKLFARRWDLALGLVLSLCLLWPLVVAPYFVHDDDIQTIRIYEMNQCMVDGQIPCRWVPDLGGGYGYPEFNYYAPLPYYVGEGFYALSHNILTAAKLTFAAGFMLAFFSAYLAASALWGRLGGSLSAIFFMFAPYHAENLYGRGAMDELWAMAAIPLAFWALLRLGSRPTRWNSLLLGAAVAVVVLCHNLSAVLVVALLGVFAVVRLALTRQATYLKHLVAAGLWAFAFSAFYVVPVLLESQYVHLETLTTHESSYDEHFADLHALMREIPWWLGNPTTNAKYLVGSVHVFAWALSLCAAFLVWRRHPQVRSIVFTFSAIMIACIYMIHPASQWVWDHGGPLAYLQFPWRFLTLVSFGTSILAGASLLLVSSHRARVALWSVLVLLVVVMNVGWFRPREFLDVDASTVLTGANWDKLRMYAIWDFLPKSAQVAPQGPTSTAVEQRSGQSDLSDVQTGSDWVKFNAASAAGATVQIDRFEFPTWETTVDGQPVPHGYDATTGLINVSVPPGEHSVEAHLRNTPPRTAGNAISAVAVAACAAVGLGAALRKRRSRADPRYEPALENVAGGAANVPTALMPPTLR